MNMYRSIGVLLGSLVLVLILVLPRAPTPMASAGAPLAQGTLTSTTFVYLPFVAKHCPTGTAPFNPTSGALRGVFEGDLPGDSGRTRLGTFDRNSGLFHYFIKFYWNLDSGENVTNGQPKSIASFANEVWSSGRMPVLTIQTDVFVDNAKGLNDTAAERLSEFASWLQNNYNGQIAVALFPEMNLQTSPYCSSAWSAETCVRVFKTAFQFASESLTKAVPTKVHVGLNYNMRWLAGSGGGIGARYSDWQVDRVYYSWVGYNVFVHTCINGTRETTDPWFLKAAMREHGNDFYQTFCASGACGTPCIIAETAASDSCSEIGRASCRERV